MKRRDKRRRDVEMFLLENPTYSEKLLATKLVDHF